MIARAWSWIWNGTHRDAYERAHSRVYWWLSLGGLPEWQTARAVQTLLAVALVQVVLLTAILIALVWR